MDVRYINPFLYGTIDVLKKMAFIEPKSGNPYVKSGNAACGDVSGIIGITGDAVGSLAISFHHDSILKIVEKMLGEPYPKINDDVLDAVGELTNMISGVARTHLEKQGMRVYAAIPTVIYGIGHTVDHVLKGPGIVIPFSSSAGDFFVDVCISSTEKPDAARQSPLLNSPIAAVREEQGRVSSLPAQKKMTQAQEALPAATEALDAAGRLELLKKQLHQESAVRDGIRKLLEEKPFMPIEQRKKLKSALPVYDARIRKLRLNVKTIEMLEKLGDGASRDPEIPKHFQHYDKPSK